MATNKRPQGRRFPRLGTEDEAADGETGFRKFYRAVWFEIKELLFRIAAVEDSITGGGPSAPVDATYVVITNDPTLTQERALAVTDPITLTDAGANSTVTVGINDFKASGASHDRGSVPDPGAAAGTTKFLREDASWQVPAGTFPQATYVCITNDATLTQERALTAGTGITITDNGANSTVVVAATGGILVGFLLGI